MGDILKDGWISCPGINVGSVRGGRFGVICVRLCVCLKNVVEIMLIGPIRSTKIFFLRDYGLKKIVFFCKCTRDFKYKPVLGRDSGCG